MPIRVLPPEVALRIAAGEVITRPADVVKELVENAIDACLEPRQAGAKRTIPPRVDVEIRAGGLGLIRVLDTGCGLASDETALAFERHATSKITSADDLFAVETLGFRGEALASIAAVGQITVHTRRPGDEVGIEVGVVDGHAVEARPWAGQAGTTVAVRSLFQNTPARLRFLRNAASDAGLIAHILGQYVVAYPELRFSLLNDGRLVIQSPGTGTLRDALMSVHDVRTVDRLLPVRAESGKVRVHGYVSPPDVDRPTRNNLSFFVNRRWVQTRTLAFAVEQAYDQTLLPGRHPVAILDLQVPPSEVDVNVHPAKTEVRFVNERGIYAVVQRAVREALLSTAPVLPLGGTLASLGDAQSPSAPPSPAGQSTGQPGDEGGVTAAGAAKQPELGAEGGAGRGSENSQRRLPILHPLGQVQRTYIVAEGPDGVYFVDQHTAHERIRYEEIQAQRQSGGISAQQLLEPLPVELTPQQAEMLSQHSEALAELGFAFELFGERTQLLRAVPAVLRLDDPVRAFLELVDSFVQEAPPEGIDPPTALLACHSAVRAGDILSLAEMRELIVRLETVDIWRYCPHGRPVVVRLDSAQLARDFRRS